MSYLTATTLDQALTTLAAGPVSIIAGGPIGSPHAATVR